VRDQVGVPHMLVTAHDSSGFVAARSVIAARKIPPTGRTRE
jgi:hypothetical protein